jgi:hypothetical protein
MTVFGLKLPFFGKSGAAVPPKTGTAKGGAGKFRLGDLQALVVIGVLFSVPIGVLIFDLFSLENAQIRTAEKEIRGLRINAELRDLQQALLAHRAPARQVADGNAAARTDQQKLLEVVKKDIVETDKVIQELGAEFGIVDEWKKAREDWQKYESGAATLNSQDVIAIHNLVYRELLVMIEEVAERSGLLLDPKLDISNIRAP